MKYCRNLRIAQFNIMHDQGHLFVAVNCAKFRGTATSQKREFRGHFAAKIDNFAAISRPKF